MPTAARSPHHRPRARRPGGAAAAVDRVGGLAGGIGLVGVFTWASSREGPPAFASVIISLRTGSSCRSDGRPHAATTSSMLGQRSAGSFSSIRMTAAAMLVGQSARSSVRGRGRWLKCAYITAMTESPWNGTFPVSISYPTTPREYWSEAPVSSRLSHCSGLMYVGVPTVTPVTVSPSAWTTFAIPKSVTTAQPSSSSMMFADLMSR